MKVLILCKPRSETDSQVQGYLREFTHRTNKTLTTLDPESREGTALCQLYDIMQFPAILVREDSGEFVQMWTEFEKWPTISELSFYAQ